MTTVAETMHRKLTEALAPSDLTIIDESHRHAGHAGARPEGETHFRIEIVSEKFAGLSRIERQRLVHQVLATELAGRVHALSLTTRMPAEGGS
ncbi:MAG: BolA family protein [Rhodoplanes sp.]|jgi:BolA family transcriptional regulator, general stress-responsive regulator